MQNQDQVESFIAELTALSIVPNLEGEFLIMEYSYEKTLQKSVVKLIDSHIGFWKSIAIEVSHTRDPNVCRYKIPLKFITGVDITDNQVLQIADNISKKIGLKPD